MGVVERPSPVPASLGYGASGPAFFLMTLVLGCLCAGDCLGCSSALCVWAAHLLCGGPCGAARGFQRHPFSNYLWHGWGRRGLSKTPFFELPLAWFGPPGAFQDTLFRVTFGMVWAARDFQRHPFSNHLVCPLVCAPALQSHCKADPCGASLGAAWACLGAWFPYKTMAKKTHVEALWWFFGPA
jgi:hypothetical protein